MLNKKKGLSDNEVLESRNKFGTNSLIKIKSKSLFKRFLENLSDPIIKILLAALVLEVIFTFGNCNLIEVFGIVAAILIATTVSTLSEYTGEKAFAKIEAETAHSKVIVLRNGREIEIDADDIVVGDIIKLLPGNKIQADGCIIEGQINVDQSALNGENIEVVKHPSKDKISDLATVNALFRGSVIISGSGYMRVDSVGTATFYGRVATDIQAETRVSPLKLRLTKLASQISKLGYIVAVLVGITYLFNVLIIDAGYVPWRIAENFKNARLLFSACLHALTLMITVVVVAVPEGLPMMITVVLSANMKRMIRDNILVKKLVGIETAGSLNILFTDKTGTLTTGKLSVESIVTENGEYKTLSALKNESEIYNNLIISAKYNTDCVMDRGSVVGGNSTDRAIYEFFADEVYSTVCIKDKTHFNSDLKYSSVTLADGSVIVKGAPEIILQKCLFTIDKAGQIYASDFSHIKRKYYDAISRGERVIAVAKSLPSKNDQFILIGIIVLKDKIRKGVKQAVKDVLKAGIQIVMVTGDNKDTALSIAEECGFYKKGAGHIVITSGELAAMSDDEVKKIIPALRVLARALPQDKTRLVRLSAELDLVVGMTGDGINDAPSLKLADVGFAMGSGTDIAKSAGDIVILDDSFEAISKTILYGRTIFKSIRKFISFQLIMNLAACGITLIGQYLGIDSPITIIQMLWVNIIMDTLGGLAFAGEAPLKYYMLEKPKRRDEPILSGRMILHIILNGVFTLALLVAFLSTPYFKSLYATPARHLTAFYALFIFAGLANCFTARSERMFIFSGILKNRVFIFIMLLITFIQLIIIYFGGALFRSSPLTARELGSAILVAMTVFLFDSFRRLILKLK